MRITNLLTAEGVLLAAAPQSKQEAIDILVDLQEKVGNISDKAAYKAGILAREESGTTAICDGIAIPHCKSDAVIKAGLVAMTVPQGVDYEALDEQPSNLFFMIAAPTNAGDMHLSVLSKLSVMLMNEAFREKLLSAESADEFIRIIDEQEAQADKAEEAPAEPVSGGYDIVGVTACPTGIAHTYMAAEALEEQGRKMGLRVKIETNGSEGVKNQLTKEDIAGAKGVIIAADKAVSLPRFDGKPMVTTRVSNGINKPEELINKVLSPEAIVYHSEASEEELPVGEEKESIGRKIYKNLMDGVSHMLPFVVGGGILIALAFLIDTIYCGMNGIPYDGNFGTNNVAASWFKTAGGLAFNFMLPILAGFIARSIADRPGLVVGFVGGWMANIGSTWAAPGGNEAGVSAGFLGAIIAGFAAGYIVKGIQFICKPLPKSLDGIKPMLIYPVLGVAAIAVVMCSINPVMILINDTISNWLKLLSQSNYAVILGVLLGAMMATDMGGPINKAAYLFGTGMLATAATYTDPAAQAMCYQCMASVMIGGMVPPIAIALATTFFPKKFSENERKSGATNYVMGLCFITEGAIPYAAGDPLRVIPACIVGSGVAGGLSMLFKCTLMAPHGGIFVLATISTAGQNKIMGIVMYFVSLVVGSLVGMLLLALLKKNKYDVPKKAKKVKA